MSSMRENECCHENELFRPNLDSYDCITDHANFETVVLNPVILEVSFIQMTVTKDIVDVGQISYQTSEYKNVFGTEAIQRKIDR